MENTYSVYIMASESRVIYTGVTNDLYRRVWEHKQKLSGGFSSRYNTFKLVYYEETDDIGAAIVYEKKIKGWLRKKKIQLIESENPKWDDLAGEWYK